MARPPPCRGPGSEILVSLRPLLRCVRSRNPGQAWRDAEVTRLVVAVTTGERLLTAPNELGRPSRERDVTRVARTVARKGIPGPGT